MNYQNKKGFTLVELLVVIAIIGLLSTIAVVSLGTARAKARDTKRIADMKQVSTALEQYYADNASYPGAIAAGYALGSGSGQTVCTGTATCNCLSNSGITNACGTTVYMNTLPTYPTATGACAGTYAAPTTGIAQYCYYSSTTSAASTDYKLVFTLENPFTAGGSNRNCVYSNTSGLVCS